METKSTNKPYAAYTDKRMGWDIWIDLGDLGAECLTDFTSASETEEQAWKEWDDYQQREKMNIRNYGFI